MVAENESVMTEMRCAEGRRDDGEERAVGMKTGIVRYGRRYFPRTLSRHCFLLLPRRNLRRRRRRRALLHTRTTTVSLRAWRPHSPPPPVLTYESKYTRRSLTSDSVREAFPPPLLAPPPLSSPPPVDSSVRRRRTEPPPRGSGFVVLLSPSPTGWGRCSGTS